MAPEDRKLALLIPPALMWFAWYVTLGMTYKLDGSAASLHPFILWRLTWKSPQLMAALLVGCVVGVALAAWMLKSETTSNGSAPFQKHLRGTKVVTPQSLARRTRSRKREQVDLAGFPVPFKAETLHFLIAGSTGTGKTVMLKRLVYSLLRRRPRRDRMVAVDPNGELYATFGRPGDKVLNAFDLRTEGWSFLNEIRNDFDYEKLAVSVVPRAKSEEGEQWRSYGRLLLAEITRKAMRSPSTANVDFITNLLRADVDTLASYLAGTSAEQLFVQGADRALGGARFVLGDLLPAHLRMPAGEFSLRSWLEDEHAGNLFITWREDQVDAILPLISCWIDIICTYALSLPADQDRNLWVMLDELATLAKMPSLIAAATKGRKHGICLVGALQSTASLVSVYGKDDAQVLRSCFRTLVVLGGAKPDPETSADLSKALGEHEVERITYNYSTNEKGSSRSRQKQVIREAVFMPAQIGGLPDLDAIVAFAGDLPIAKTTLEVQDFVKVNSPFEPRVL